MASELQDSNSLKYVCGQQCGDGGDEGGFGEVVEGIEGMKGDGEI